MNDATPIKKCLIEFNKMPTAEEEKAALEDDTGKLAKNLGSPENILKQLNYVGERIT